VSNYCTSSIYSYTIRTLFEICHELAAAVAVIMFISSSHDSELPRIICS